MNPTILPLFSLTIFSLPAHAQSPTSKVPAVLPHMEDIKTPPRAFPKPDGSVALPQESGAHRPVSAAARPLGATAASQSSTAAPKSTAPERQAPAIDHTHLYFDDSADDTLWVRGASWKASFGAERTLFIPFFGADAPRNYPVEMRIASVTVGGAPVPLNMNAHASRSGNQVRFERGGLTEVYDLGLDSIEQSFVFASLPHGAGSSSSTLSDLVLRVGVESELARTLSAQGVELANEHGRVVLGRATVRDADGSEIPIEGILDGNEIVWRVPSDFLAAASFPVTIDPVIVVFAIQTGFHLELLPDVAYDTTTGLYVTVMEEAFSGTDHDIFSRTTDAAGNVAYSSYVDITTDFWITPRVANNALASQFMVVAEVYSDSPTSIKGRQCSAGTLSYGPVLTVNGAESGPKGSPDIGGDPSFSAPTYYLVTWGRMFSSTDSDIHGALFGSSGTNVSGTIFIDNSASTEDTVPRVSKSDGAAPASSQVWTVVWDHQFSSTDNDIYAAQVAWDGVIAQPTYVVDNSLSNDIYPAVSSIQDGIDGARRYMVAAMANGTTGFDVYGWVCDGTTLLVHRDLSYYEGAVLEQKDQYSPSVDCDGKRFAVAYTEVYSPSPQDDDMKLLSFEYSNADLLEVEFVTLANSTTNQNHASVTSAHSGGGASGTFMAVWDDVPNGSGTGDIYGAIYALTTFTSFCVPGVGNAQFCPCSNNPLFTGTGCNNSANTGGAVLNASGSPSADTVVLSASGMLPNANAIYLQGDSIVNGSAIFGDGVRCAGGHLLRLALKHSVGGASSYPEVGDLSISARSAQLGGPIQPGSQRFYQTYYRDPIGFPSCTATFNATNGVVIDW